MSSFSGLLQIFTFTQRPWIHLVAKEKEKIRMIFKSLVSLRFIFKPKSHIFNFTYKYFLNGISNIAKTIEKTRFLCQNDPKNTKSQQIETFLHVIDDKKLQVFENPYRETPKSILYVQSPRRGGVCTCRI